MIFVCRRLGISGVSIERDGLPTHGSGLDHSAIVHAASRLPHCSLIHAGAHDGTIAILAAKLGCRVWAFEASLLWVNQMTRNMRGNCKTTA